MAQLFSKILIANRGEVAVRIILACQKLHIATVAVYSDADKHSPYVNMADEAIHIGDSRAAESYLNQDKILQAARLTGSDAIHPGFGFLSENPVFAKNCIETGIHFIGPCADNMLLMSSKSASKELVASLDLPIIPGLANPAQDSASLFQAATDIGYPVLIKASAGGGGMGMRVVNAKDEFENALAATKQEAKNSFGDDHVLVEKYFKKVRHIEVQLLCDQHGKALHCYERECSIQRRRQKVVEEAPAASISDNLRNKICQASVKIAQAVNYQGLGTVEFMVEEGTDNFYFLEMNTRLQVEHGISEKITGLDLVALQIEIAQGHALSLRQEDIKIIGHAIECRLYAEDPQQNFIPSVGTILHWRPFSGEGIRSDAGIASGSQVSSFYDPMLAKLISFGEDRPTAIRAMNRHLENTQLLGITTNQSFLKNVLRHPDFLTGKTNTDFIEHNIQSLTPSLTKQDVNKLLLVAAAQRALAEEVGLVNHLPNTRHFQLALNDHSYGLFVSHNGQDGYDVNLEKENFKIEILKHQLTNGVGEMLLAIEGHSERYTYAIGKNVMFVHSNKIAAHKVSYVSRFSNSNLQTDGAGYQAAMPGRIIEVLVNAADTVKKGDKLLTMESMKMEHSTFAKSDGRVAELFVVEGNLVNKGDTLIDIHEQ